MFVNRRLLTKRIAPRHLRLEPLEARLAPATFVVTTRLDIVDKNDNRVSLREAVTQANTQTGADTIVLPAGVYKLTRTGAKENANDTGDLDITESVLIKGAGASVTAIDGQHADRVFDVRGTAAGSVVATFRGLTVRNGFTNDSFGGGGILAGNADLIVDRCAVTGNQATNSGAGGGISGFVPNTAANVTLIRSTVSRNAASNGGGIWVWQFTGQASGGQLTAEGSTISHNVSGNFGGGLAADEALLTKCTIVGNRARYDGGGIDTASATLIGCAVTGNVAGSRGGGIGNGILKLTDCTVAGNRAEDGGGLQPYSATLTRTVVRENFASHDGGGILGNIGDLPVSLVGCTVSGNVAANAGGGIVADVVTLADSTVADNAAVAGDGGGILARTQAGLTGCTVSGNSAREGGGIFAKNGFVIASVDLTNCTISGNSASTTGGGISANDLSLINVTVTDNSAATGGGVAQSGSGTATVKNSIIAQNVVAADGFALDVSGIFVSLGHNLIGIGLGAAGSGAFVDGVNGDQVGTPIDPIDARLGPLANHGGPTKTHALLAGSPAIDAGDTPSAPAIDQRGIHRPRGSAADIGAYER
jgi:predicted outer membrane repeat protein